MADVDLEMRLAESAPEAALPDGLDAHTRRILRSVRARRGWSRSRRLLAGGVGVVVLSACGVAAAAGGFPGGDWGISVPGDADGDCTLTWNVQAAIPGASSPDPLWEVPRDRVDAAVTAFRDILQSIDVATLDPEKVAASEAEWRQALEDSDIPFGPHDTGRPDGKHWTESYLEATAQEFLVWHMATEEMLRQGFTETEIRTVSGSGDISDGCF